MKIQFRVIGKNHDLYVKEGIQIFTNRIQHYYSVEWKIIPPSKLSGHTEACTAETKLLLQRQPGDFIIALDERGRQVDSPALAHLIEQQALNSIKMVIFAIGGAYGFDQKLIRDSDITLSLSKLTFPHQLVRLILAEQVYRACTIIRGEGYHH